jgi:hypothetical protein
MGSFNMFPLSRKHRRFTCFCETCTVQSQKAFTGFLDADIRLATVVARRRKSAAISRVGTEMLKYISLFCM